MNLTTARKWIGAALTCALSACISTGGGGGGQPPPTPTVQAMAVVVTDLEHPGSGVEGVAVDCGNASRGVTNRDGYTVFTSFSHVQADCTMTKDGWLTNTASHVPTPSDHTLNTWIRVIAPEPPTAPAHPDPLVGRVRWEGGCYRDDTGCKVLTYAHAGNFFAQWTRDHARIEQQLDLVAAAGFHGLRVWGTLGCDGGACTQPGQYWYGNDVNPTITPDYDRHMREFFVAVKTRNLRLQWSQGDVRSLARDQRGYMVALAAADNGVLDWVDGANEGYVTGEPSAENLARLVGYYAAAGGTALKTLTDAPIYSGGSVKEVFDRYSQPPADAFEIHSNRGGHCRDKRRHSWGYTYDDPPSKPNGMSSEPPGGGSRVSVIDNRHEMDDECTALIALGSALGRQAFVWFSGEGVIMDNGLQTMPGFYSVPRAMRLLPRDVMTFRTIHHSGDAWRTTRVIAAKGEVRIDGRIGDDGRFSYTIDGPAGHYSLDVARGFAGQLCDPGTGVCQEVTKTAGERLDVSFKFGRLLVGRVH